MYMSTYSNNYGVLDRHEFLSSSRGYRIFVPVPVVWELQTAYKLDLAQSMFRI